MVKSGIELISKVIKIFYKSITSIAESTLPVNDEIKNLFCGIFVKALPYIFNFLDFLKTNGANIEVDRYKAQLKDMNLNSCFVQSFWSKNNKKLNKI